MNPLSRPLGLVSLVASLVACSSGSGSSTPGVLVPAGVVGATNVASDSLSGQHGLWVVQVPENGARDLNGDGDRVDVVAHLIDLDTDELTNLKTGSTFAEVHGNRVLLLESEFFADADLNGDGDRLDQVLRVFDVTTRRLVTYLEPSFDLLGAQSFSVVGDLVFFVVQERGEDLDGDGDGNDNVLHWIDLARRSARAQNTKLAINVVGATVGAGFGVQGVENAARGDLNGDGDQDDLVFHVFDPARREMVSTGFATEIAVEVGGRWILGVNEDAQGADLDGNGTVGDRVFFLFDLVNGATPLGVSNPEIALLDARDDLAFLVGSEAAMQRDLNDDGDLDDWVPQAYDAESGLVTSTRFGLGRLGLQAFFERGFAFLTDEEDQGEDLNGDGDALDRIVVAFDAATGVTTPLGVNSAFLEGAGSDLLLFPFEGDEGVDLNGDADQDDIVLQLWNPTRAQPLNTGWATREVLDTLAGRYLLLVVEDDQGDLTGDGDTDDILLVDYPDPTLVHLWPGNTTEVFAPIARYVDRTHSLNVEAVRRGAEFEQSRDAGALPSA